MNQILQERLELNIEGLKSVLEQPVSPFFKETANMLLFVAKVYETNPKTLEQKKKWNEQWYQNILPDVYESSYGNPTYCVKTFGQEYGQLFSFLYTELRGTFVYAMKNQLFDIVILNELFLQIYGLFVNKEDSKDAVQNAIYNHMRDYSEDIIEYRIKEQLNPSLDFATKIIMESDFSNPDFLYHYGEYISDNERNTLKYLNQLSKEQLSNIAKTYVEGFHDGFIINNIDMSPKKTVNIRYTIGFEPIIREAINQFREIGLVPIIYGRGHSCMVNKIGYSSTSPNQQFEYDHRQDDSLFFDKRFMQHKLECYRNSYERMKNLAYELAGPACMETFGETPFLPENKEENLKLSSKQQNLSVEFQGKASEIINEYIKPDQRSYTIIAYPIPEIGNNFEKIFEEVVKVNTLDKKKYQKIQQHLINTLDQGSEVHIKGAGKNETDIYVSLRPMGDPQKETNFENCLADVNIPVGEVFTSPKLQGTNGTLHVSEVYLGDLKYIDLNLQFKDGKIASYNCSNFGSKEENKDFIKENLLHNQETLPMGEFAIGTNTTAYAMAKKYDILYKLPILIVEKMGPHFAVGDTCYSHSEMTEVHNPDGKEIMAKHNECSLNGEYFQCHTDITIPYEELDSISVIKLGGEEVPIMQNGRFVLEGTQTLNEPLTEIDTVGKMETKN